MFNNISKNIKLLLEIKKENCMNTYKAYTKSILRKSDIQCFVRSVILYLIKLIAEKFFFKFGLFM